uniref:Alternative oxidase n=1 Tax=Trypanosoma vivax (strain Y486) TaxID=1055687 RepID=G0U744_TRYVY|nr:putative alternative oxidase [Trypanosoma vivax Y486]
MLRYRTPTLAAAAAMKVQQMFTHSSSSSNKTPVWGYTQVNRLSFVDLVPRVPAREEDESSSERPHWNLPDIEKVAITHKPAEGIVDTLAYRLVRTCRWAFDTFSLYRFGSLTEQKVINRCLFLETVAGVPGMVGGMLRHLTSLRQMRRDKGWINTLLVEAENERMHLMTFIELRQARCRLPPVHQNHPSDHVQLPSYCLHYLAALRASFCGLP